ncbi:hypothetical protein BC941DRAFT_439574 [Chlamydoabsidia padenii]|nr:hypothetical protein BC941DRAFT_439574 [Chlamydoabsidia padenii]
MLRSWTSRLVTANINVRTITTKPPRLAKTTFEATTKNEGQHRNQQPWQPIKRVSRVTMEKIRTLAALHPEHYNSVSLAAEFRISPEAVKRILKSKFRPDPVIADRQEKNRYAAMGVRKQQIQSKSINFTGSSTTNEPSSHHLGKKSTQLSSPDRRWNNTRSRTK